MAGGSPGSGLVKGPQNVLSGLMFIGIGLGGIWFGRDLPMGTPIRLGTGVFPYLLCWGLIVIGGIVLVQGLLTTSNPIGKVAWRPVVLIALAASLFAVLIEPAGLLAATLGMMVVSVFAGDDHKVKEFSIFAVIMLIMAWFLFIFILDMPVKVFPWS